MKSELIALASIIMVICSCSERPCRLTTDLIENTDIRYAAGNLAQINPAGPSFNWVLPDNDKYRHPVSYRILVASSESLLKEGKADLWDSGICPDEPCIRYRGIPLEADRDYFWKVRVWTEKGRSRYSHPKSFHTGNDTREVSHYPLQTSIQDAETVTGMSEDVFLSDFGKDAFAQPLLRFRSDCGKKVKVRLAEALDSCGRADRNPGGTIRYAEYELSIEPGDSSYRIELRRDARNARGYDDPDRDDAPPVLMPEYVGEVFPFRYVEVEGAEPVSVSRIAVNYPFNDGESFFRCSDDTLNMVWDLCKYSIKETSFCGMYVDGDRERIPYEADALLNQLSHYCVDREYSLARRSLEYLLNHATWPTEWQLQMPLVAWYDYLYTGDDAMISRYYDLLVAKSLRSLRDERGLISTVGTLTEDLMKSINFRDGWIRDIVDWPRVGGFGAPGEDDAYDMTTVNTVVNAFHYASLKCLSGIAVALGEEDDATMFSEEAEMTARSINEIMYDREAGAYRDGEGSTHHALHASMFPLAFGIVPQETKDAVCSFIRSKGMVCSVYASQFLLEGLYDNGAPDYALELMRNTSDRGWYNMIREGSTVTMEAWGFKYKPNLDWNHAWGAAPANIIPRKLAGVRPVKAGFRTAEIRPQPGDLEWFEAKVPTIMGPISVKYDKRLTPSYEISVPSGMTALISLPESEETLVRESGKYRL